MDQCKQLSTHLDSVSDTLFDELGIVQIELEDVEPPELIWSAVFNLCEAEAKKANRKPLNAGETAESIARQIHGWSKALRRTANAIQKRCPVS